MANKGGKKGGGNKRSTKRSARYNKMAANNIALQDQPQADMYGMLQQQAQADELRKLQTADSVYGGAYDRIKDVGSPDFSGIANRMNESIGALAPQFGGGEPAAYMAPGEVEAGQGLGLANVGAGNTMLANLAARNKMAQGSSQRQAALGGQYAGDQVMQEMRDSLEQYRNQLANLRANDPYQIQQEATRLEDQAMSRQLAQSQIRGDEAFADYLQKMLAGQVGSNVRPQVRDGGGGSNEIQRTGVGREGQTFTPPTPPPGPGGGGPGTQYGGGQIGPRGEPQGVGPAGRSDAVPPAWWNAQTFGQLPGAVKGAYGREPGTSLREAFQQSAHPSFDNFRDFRRIYEAFLPRINRLYRQTDPTNAPGWMTGQQGGGYTGR